jgi:hypothetical protein
MATTNLDSFSDREPASRIITDHAVRAAGISTNRVASPFVALTRDDWRPIQNAHDGVPMQVWFDPDALVCTCMTGARVVLANYPRSAMHDKPSGVGLVCLSCHESAYADANHAAESTNVFQFIVEGAIRGQAARCPLYFSKPSGRDALKYLSSTRRPIVRFHKAGTVGRSPTNAIPRQLALFEQIPETAEDVVRRGITRVRWHGQYPETYTLKGPVVGTLDDGLVPVEPLPDGSCPAKIVGADPVTGHPVELEIKSSYRKPFDPRTLEERARGGEKANSFALRYANRGSVQEMYDDLMGRIGARGTTPPPDWSDAAALAERALTLLTSAGQVHDFVGTRTKQHAADCRACRGVADAKRALEMLRAYQKGRS